MEEKQQRLFNAAHDLFLTQGFKATNISAIAAGANVAVGTFYNFYQSKTDVFVQVYNAENDRVKRTILANVDFDQAPNPLIKTILKQILDQSANNRILQEWFTNAKLNGIIAKTNAVTVENSFIYATLVTLIDRWLAAGLLKPTMTKSRVLSLFNALTVVDFHQSELQTDDYFQLLGDLIDAILLKILK